MKQSNSTKATPVLVKTVLRDEAEKAIGVSYAFSNGVAFNLFADQLSTVIAAEALCHGISQKVGDAAAISRITETGQPASVSDKAAASREVYERLLAGSWNAEREGGGGQGTFLLRALVEYYGGKHSAESLKTKLEAMSAEQKGALLSNEKIAVIIARLKAERVDPEIDSNALLDQLDDEAEAS